MKYGLLYGTNDLLRGAGMGPNAMTEQPEGSKSRNVSIGGFCFRNHDYGVGRYLDL